jgi:Flp pilus assembly protein TadG
MQSIRNRNERGSVLVFVTLMMVLLFVMVGMGVDMGQLSYVRSQGQPAVDAAALAAVNALPTLDVNEVYKRAAQLNFNSGSNPGGNNYLNSPNNLISGTSGTSGTNVTLINYDETTGTITAAGSIGTANGVRVALETTNPYGGAANTPMKSPMFLTPLLNLLGQKTSGTQNVSVSAVAVQTAIPGFPVAIAGCSPPPPSANCAPGGLGTEASPYTNCRLLQTSNSNNGNGNGNTDTLTYNDSGWTTFTIPSANAPDILKLIHNNSTCGNIPPITVGSCIYLNNGQITPVLREFSDVYSSNPDGLSGTGSTPNPNDWGVIPVVDPNLTNFNGCKQVIGWAKFGLRNVEINGNDKYLVGDLICGWDIHKSGGTGCYTTQLVRDKPSGM